MRRGRVAGLVVLTALAACPPAQASLGLAFDRPTASLGEQVKVWNADSKGRPFPTSPIAHGSIRVYLVALRWADAAGGPTRDGNARMGPPDLKHLVFVGSLSRVHRVPKLTFRVPQLPPGRYTTVLWCRPCAPGAGSVFSSRLYPAGARTSYDPDPAVLRVRA
jgi:hypothetical protein